MARSSLPLSLPLSLPHPGRRILRGAMRPGVRLGLLLGLLLGLIGPFAPAASADALASVQSPAGRYGEAGAAPARRGDDEAGTGLWRAIGWSLLILVVAVVAILLAMWFRRQLMGRPSRLPPESAGFSLAELRRLHAEGKISDDEYERARARLVDSEARVLGPEAREPIPAGTPRTKDVDLIREVE